VQEEKLVTDLNRNSLLGDLSDPKQKEDRPAVESSERQKRQLSIALRKSVGAKNG